MADSSASADKNLLWAILILVVVSGLVNAFMTSSVSRRVAAIEGNADSHSADLPDIRPIVGTIQRSKVKSGHRPAAPTPTASEKTPAKAKAKAKGSGGGKHGSVDAKLKAFADSNGLPASQTAEMTRHIHACYEALDRINGSAKAGKIDKTQRQKRMLSELKKRDDRLQTLLGEELASQLKKEVLTKG